MVIYLPLLICIIGAMIFYGYTDLSRNEKIAKLGIKAFEVGLLVTLLTLAILARALR